MTLASLSLPKEDRPAGHLTDPFARAHLSFNHYDPPAELRQIVRGGDADDSGPYDCDARGVGAFR
jgi:hypothetical protein